MFLGFALMFVTGGLLFWSYAAKCYASSYFRAKIVLLLLAAANVLIYQFTIDRRCASWDRAPISSFTDPARRFCLNCAVDKRRCSRAADAYHLLN